MLSIACHDVTMPPVKAATGNLHQDISHKLAVKEMQMKADKYIVASLTNLYQHDDAIGCTIYGTGLAVYCKQSRVLYVARQATTRRQVMLY